MTINELRSLPVGTKLTYVIGEGSYEERHPAKLDRQASYYTGVLVYFTTKPQALIRWSTATNKPIGESFHRGTVRLIR